jgi:hypothetical protein
MSLSRKVGGKLACVFANTSQFRMEIQTNDKNLHATS